MVYGSGYGLINVWSNFCPRPIRWADIAYYGARSICKIHRRFQKTPNSNEKESVTAMRIDGKRVDLDTDKQQIAYTIR